MTNEENIRDLKTFVKNGEERVASYKVLLQNAFKENQPKWFKESLRDSKNFEMNLLKGYRKELEHINQGLNPPYCYSRYE